MVRERYEAAAAGYDELYGEEQLVKYTVALRIVKPRGTVLDAGCGTGLLAEYMEATGLLRSIERYICLDYSKSMLSIAEERLRGLCPDKCQTVMGNVESIPLPPLVANVTYSFTVLDLVERPEKALSELIRVTRGFILVTFIERLGTWKKLGLNYIARAAGDVIGLVEGRRAGGDQADALGGAGQCRLYRPAAGRHGR
jgi:ubiquinone/menaquinone biosynthesis C-methylase UbiE